MKYSRTDFCCFGALRSSSWLSLGLAVACSVGGEDIGSTRDDDQGGEGTTSARSTDAGDVSPSRNASTSNGAPVGPSAALGPGERPQSEETSTAPECVPPPSEFVDFLSISFVNHTDEPLYLASSNEDCGVPVYVELRRDGEKMDLYPGKCALDCEVIRSSSGQGDVEPPPRDCDAAAACDAPVKVIQPNVTDIQSLLPVVGTAYDVPGSCFADGANVTCQVQHALSAGKYTLIAHAYTELECDGQPCECYQEVGGACLPTGDVLPQGAGELRTVEVELDFNPQRFGVSVQFDFNVAPSANQ
jgi:hypothetical protein